MASSSTKPPPTFTGEGIAGAFGAQSSSANTFLSGVFLAGVENPQFADARLDGLNAAETDPNDPINLGLVMIGDWHLNSGHNKIYEGIVANAGSSPVFMIEGMGSDFDTVFKKDDALFSNSFPLSSDYPDVYWGVWTNQPSQVGPTAYYDLLATSTEEFDFLPWLVIPALDPDTEITTYTGTANYGFTRAFNAVTSWADDVSALNVSLGVDFDTGYIDEGTINLCFGGSSCGDADEAWHGHFSDSTGDLSFTPMAIKQGILPLMSVSGFTEDTMGNSGSFYGEIGGSVVGYNAGAAYDAVAGGFNLTTGVAVTDRSVSGTFLSEQEHRATPLDMNYIDGFQRGALMKGNGAVYTGLMGPHQTDYPSSVFFIDESTTENTFMVLGAYNDPNMIHWNQFGSVCSGCNLEFGIWDGSVSLLADNNSSSPTGSHTGPIAWVNYTPQDFTEIGLVRLGADSGYASQSFKSLDSVIDITGNAQDTFDFDLEVLFSNSVGAIEDTTLIVTNTETIDSVLYKFVWTLDFRPDNDVVQGAGLFNAADFTSDSFTGGKLEVIDVVEDVVIDTVEVDNAIFTGVISYDPDSTFNRAYIAGSIMLEAQFDSYMRTIDTRVIGDYENYGYRETRLSHNELLSMNDYLGVLVKQTSHIVDEHYLTNGNNAAIIFGQTGLTDGQLAADADESIHDELFDYDPIPLLQETGSGINNDTTPSVVTDDFDVGWGVWNGGADIIDAVGGSTSFVSGEDLYWLSARRADIADLQGEWRYGGFDDMTGSPNALSAGFFEGSGDAGTLTGLGMSFDVDFGSGFITDGKFEAQVGTDHWFTEFSGNAHGPTAVITSFSNGTVGTNADYSLNPGANITGEMRGIFTTGDFNDGFAAGFSLHEDAGGTYLNGVGLIDGRGIIPAL